MAATKRRMLAARWMRIMSRSRTRRRPLFGSARLRGDARALGVGRETAAGMERNDLAAAAADGGDRAGSTWFGERGVVSAERVYRWLTMDSDGRDDGEEAARR